MSISRVLAASTLAVLAGNVAAQCSNYGLSQGTIVVDADDAIRRVGLPFSFPFAGSTYSTLLLSTNGWIKFGTPATTSSELGDTEALMLGGSPRIALCWDDLNPGTSGNGDIYYWADANQAVITFQGVSRFGAAGTLANCECVLLPSGDIYLNYDASSTFALSTSSSIVGISAGGNLVAPGANAIVGIGTAAGMPINSWTGYELFPATGFNLAGKTLHYAPVAGPPGSYTLTASPFTMGPCAPATPYPPAANGPVVSVGVGCPPPVPNHSIYELFTVATGTNPVDLTSPTSVSIQFLRLGDTYMTVPGTGFDPIYTVGVIEPAAADDVMVNYPLTMGAFPVGSSSITSVTLSTNGYIWLGANTLQQLNASVASFHSGGPRVAGYWIDLVPDTSAAPIYIENTPGFFRATWENVPLFSGGGAQTFQILLDVAGNVTLSYLSATGVGSVGALVGITGGAATDLGSSDLATSGFVNSIGPVQITGGYGPMVYTANGPPRIGQDLVMTSSIPAPANCLLGGFLIGTVNPNITLEAALSLVPGSAPGCMVYSDFVAPSPFFTPFLLPAATSITYTLPVPYDPSLAGYALTSQAFALFIPPALTPANSSGFLTSNGLTFTSGL